MKSSSLRLSALAVLTLIVGVVLCTFLAYFVLGLVQLTTFLLEVIARGWYG
ncbi:hypothetical protein SEA_DJUNGELSKOG_5 [Arthrobacter phage Djungelskog]|nr:hypothetical protein PBI_LINDA_5 [Arthrobacter phage Linda]WNO27691.1 hypothetical protein SEA_DJUNGELSKOG_5 [Arthrobacter phage Djungelskog]